MFVERNKTYITAGGYVVKLDYNLCSPPDMSPGQNDDYCGAGLHGWHWEKDGRILGLLPEWMEKLKIIEECPFELPALPDGYKWADGFPQVRIPKRGEYFLGYDSRTKKFGKVKCCGRNYVTPYDTDGRRLILAPVAQKVVKYYKHREKFGGGIVFIKRIGDTYGYVFNNCNPNIDQLWNRYCNTNVKDGVWVEILESDAFKLLNINSVTSVPDVSSFKKEEGNTVKKETALKVVGAVARFAGNWGFRALNYWVFEPAAGFGRPIVKSVRYATFLAMVGGSVYGYFHPQEAKDAIKSCLPKITIEAPEIMQG